MHIGAIKEESKSPADLDLLSIPPPLSFPKHLMGYYNFYHELDLPFYVLGPPKLIGTNRNDYGDVCVVDLWKYHITILFRHLPEKWMLNALPDDVLPNSSFHLFKDHAKVRFLCLNCKVGWTSMYGVVMWFCRRTESGEGQIFFKVLGQKCRMCGLDIFYSPIWYPEEAQKVITNLFYNIASNFYGRLTPPLIRSRRLGFPSTNHAKSHCEGCYTGLCDSRFLLPKQLTPQPETSNFESQSTPSMEFCPSSVQNHLIENSNPTGECIYPSSVFDGSYEVVLPNASSGVANYDFNYLNQYQVVPWVGQIPAAIPAPQYAPFSVMYNELY